MTHTQIFRQARPHQLESRTLENCLSGSEGGGAFALPTPIFTPSHRRGGSEVMVLPHDLDIARRSEEQCSIGFQPVFIHAIQRCFPCRTKLCTKPRVETGLKPWAESFKPFGVTYFRGAESRHNPGPHPIRARSPRKGAAFLMFLRRAGSGRPIFLLEEPAQKSEPDEHDRRSDSATQPVESGG